jgi:hypothetical protein
MIVRLSANYLLMLVQAHSNFRLLSRIVQGAGAGTAPDPAESGDRAGGLNAPVAAPADESEEVDDDNPTSPLRPRSGELDARGLLTVMSLIPVPAIFTKIPSYACDPATSPLPCTARRTILYDSAA